MQSIMTQVLVVSGISGLLALLLSIANRTIANYGEQKLVINDEKEYSVEGGDTLLSTLISEEIFIPSACGGKGSCGYCKVHVSAGGGQFLPTEAGYVTPEEQEEGVRLSCQVKVKEEIHIRIPEELFNVRQYDYLVTKLNLVTPKILHLRLELTDDKEIEFKPGQYIQILAPMYPGNDEDVYRAYSIASAPSDKKAIELFIGYVPEGVATTYVHQHLRLDDRLTVIGPFGDFYYHHNDRDMYMVAVGTGMAPIMSILKYMRDEKIDRKVTFFFGARSGDDLYMMDTLKALEGEIPNFKLVCCLSRPRDEDQWAGDEGRVTDLIEKYVEDASTAEAYLCGSPKVIDAVVDRLSEKGMPEEHIYYDKFE